MKSSRIIDPLRDLGDVLLTVEKPARYVGGEYGAVRKDKVDFTVGIAFPDLYEIGMSNQALRIIYNGLNRLDGVSCERVFAPAPDFEDALRRMAVPLYTLERGTPLADLDMLGITMGYELGITGALSILQSGAIPIKAASRGEDDPIIIMGGPASSNPIPFSRFVDAVWVGEAEGGFFSLVGELKDLKRAGARRSDLLKRMADERSVWMPGKKARRAVYSDFAAESAEPNIFPVASMKIVQENGAVEIMRGCPNGCRFCHAGLWYRPMRQKSALRIRSDVESIIRKGGYREITLSSLSSGDYAGIDQLVADLSRRYRDRNVSFQLPSLKISTFSLSLLEQLSEVRKSGLTFAVETPVDAWQRSINKDVHRDSVISILREAKSKGWRMAKFYFMIGLPVGDAEHGSEEEEIVDFLMDISKQVGVQISVNVGTFVPKPHTPYQWAPQLTEEESSRKLTYIRGRLKHGNFKIGTHDAFTSVLEGIISRGDEGVGELIEAAFRAGCRLDAWDEYIKKDVWRAMLAERSDLVGRSLCGKDFEERLPWDDIEGGVGQGFLKREFRRSQAGDLSSKCEEKCTEPCGSCVGDSRVVQNIIHDDVSDGRSELPMVERGVIDPHAPSHQVLFSFTKSGSASFVPHLSVIEVFSKAFIRAALPIKFTEGFNPVPKLNFAAPLSVGILADAEMALVETLHEVPVQDFLTRMNSSLPEGFSITSAYTYKVPEGVKKVSAASILWGFSYLGDDGREVFVPFEKEKEYRSTRGGSEDGGRRFGLRRLRVLARGDNVDSFESYFDAYRKLYEQYK